MNNLQESKMIRSEKSEMRKGHRDWFRIHYVDIVEQCESSATLICNYLYNRGILSFYQKETILGKMWNSG